MIGSDSQRSPSAHHHPAQVTGEAVPSIPGIVSRAPVARGLVSALSHPSVVVVVVLAVLLLRDPYALLLPILHCEDGRDVFAHYLNHREWSALLRSYAGYVALVPNALGYALATLPIAWIPHALVAAPMLIAALAFSTFAWKRFRAIVADDAARGAICVLLALLPYGNHALIGNTMYSLHSLLLWLLLLTLAPLPRSAWGCALQTIGMISMAASNPLSIALLPVVAWRALRAELLRDRFCWVLLGCTILVYLASHGTRELELSVSAIERLFDGALLFVHRVVLEGSIGLGARNALRHRIGGIPTLILASAWSGFLAWQLWLRRGTLLESQRELLALAGITALALTLVSALARPEHDVFSTWGHRYTYIPRILFMLAVAIVATRQPWLYDPHTAPRALAAVLAVLALQNGLSNRFYVAPREQGRQVAAFTQRLDAEERNAAPGERIQARLDRGQWTIRVDYVAR